MSTSPEGRHHRSNSRDTTLRSTFDTIPLWPCTRTALMDARIIYLADKRCSCSHCIVPPLHHHAATLHMPRLPPCMLLSGSVAQTRKSLACRPRAENTCVCTCARCCAHATLLAAHRMAQKSAQKPPQARRSSKHQAAQAAGCLASCSSMVQMGFACILRKLYKHTALVVVASTG